MIARSWPGLLQGLCAVVTISLMVGPFAMSTHAAVLSGTWVGNGYVEPSEGARERVRCRVTYSPRGTKIVGVEARCASASATIRQTGELVKVNDSRYVGDFSNVQFNISGRVRVIIDGGTQTVTFSSASGGGQMTLRRR